MDDKATVIDAGTGEVLSKPMQLSAEVTSLSDYRGSMALAQSNLDALREYVKFNFKETVDFGPPFQGSDKNSLLLPGAEKFNLLFNVRPRFIPIDKVIDLNNGFCLYHLGCELVHKQTGIVVGYGEGSCNSYESKFRYRNASRVCPVCGKETIKKSRFPPREDSEAEPGWYCYEKIGGCGENFSAHAPEIVQQEVGKVENDNLFDIWNTILKQAEKRSMVAAVVYTGGVSELFTQDADEFAENENAKPKNPSPKAPAPKAAKPASPVATKVPIEPGLMVDMPSTKAPVLHVATKATPTAEPKPVAVVSPPESFPVIEPTNTGDFIHEITLWNGAKKPMNGIVGESNYVANFMKMYVGKAKKDEEGPADDLESTGKWNPAHLTNHLRSRFHVDFLKDLTWEKFNALVKYTLMVSVGDGRGGYDAKWYADKIQKATGDAPVAGVDLATVDEIPYGELKYSEVMTAWGETFFVAGGSGVVSFNDTILQVWGVFNPQELTQEQLTKLALVIEARKKGNLTADEVVGYLRAE